MATVMSGEVMPSAVVGTEASAGSEGHRYFFIPVCQLTTTVIGSSFVD